MLNNYFIYKTAQGNLLKIPKLRTLQSNQSVQNEKSQELCMNTKYRYFHLSHFKQRQHKICEILKTVGKKEFKDFIAQLQNYEFKTPEVIYLPQISDNPFSQPYLDYELKTQYESFVTQELSHTQYHNYLSQAFDFYKQDKKMQDTLSNFLKDWDIKKEITDYALKSLEQLYVYEISDIQAAFSYNFTNEDEFNKWKSHIGEQPNYFLSLEQLQIKKLLEQSVENIYFFKEIENFEKAYVLLFCRDFDNSIVTFKAKNSASLELEPSKELKDTAIVVQNKHLAIATKSSLLYKENQGIYMVATYQKGCLQSLDLEPLLLQGVTVKNDKLLALENELKILIEKSSIKHNIVECETSAKTKFKI